MLTNSPIVRSVGVRVLFLVGAVVTVIILQCMQQMRLSGDQYGLTTIFFVLFADKDLPGAFCTLLILVGAILISQDEPAHAALRWTGHHPLLIAVISVGVLAAGSLIVYHDHPLSMDEYAGYFQSRVFAAGHLSGSLPLQVMDWLIPPGFQDYFLNVSRATGAVTESYWPGFALLLTPFMWAGVPWLCNPLISALTLLVIHRLALEIFADREAAGFALMLSAASPVIFAEGISYYSMPAHLLANSVFALLLVRPSALRCATAGVVGSLALALHNPVPHMLFALPWLLWIATRQGGVRLLAALCAGYLPLGVLLGLGWFLFSGHLMHDGVVTIASPARASDRLHGMLSVFSLPTATVSLARLIGIAKIWVWAVPGVVILAAVGAVRWRHDRRCQLLAASAVLTLVGYFFVPVDQGHGWGYRYFHSAWMVLPLLATAAMFRPSGATSDGTAGYPIRIFEDVHTRTYVAACIALTLLFGVGFRAWQMQNFLATDLGQLPHYPGTERRVVIVDPTLSFYGADLVQNDPWLRGNVIRMYTHGRVADQQMMAQAYPAMHLVFADRHGWVWSEKSNVALPR